jgi:hypothetical protein
LKIKIFAYQFRKTLLLPKYFRFNISFWYIFIAYKHFNLVDKDINNFDMPLALLTRQDTQNGPGYGVLNFRTATTLSGSVCNNLSKLAQFLLIV